MDRLPGAHPAPVQLRRAADDRIGQARRGAHHRRDLPALPDLHRRGDPRRRNAVQVLPADPGGAATGSCCGRACATAIIDIVVSDHSPCTADLKRLDTGDFGVAWGGIASLQLGLPAVWTAGASAGLRPGRRRPLDGDRRRPTQVGLRRQGPHRRRRTTPTSGRVRARRRRSSSTRAACTTRTRSRRTPDVPSRRRSAQHLAARASTIDIDDEPPGRLLSRGADDHDARQLLRADGRPARRRPS